MHICTYIASAAMLLAVSTFPAHSENEWHLRGGAPGCPNYFSVQEAQLAHEAGDLKWLAETGCQSISGKPELTIIDRGHLDQPGATTRVRLRHNTGDAITVYVKVFNIMGYHRGRELSYLDVYSARANEALSLSQPKSPLGSQLTKSDINLVRAQLIPCFNPPFGAAKEKPDLVADIRVVMNRDGTVQQAQVADPGKYAGDPIYRAIADTGIRALRNPVCSPLRFSSDRYSFWQTFVFGFSIKDLQ